MRKVTRTLGNFREIAHIAASRFAKCVFASLAWVAILCVSIKPPCERHREIHSGASRASPDRRRMAPAAPKLAGRCRRHPGYGDFRPDRNGRTSVDRPLERGVTAAHFALPGGAAALFPAYHREDAPGHGRLSAIHAELRNACRQKPSEGISVVCQTFALYPWLSPSSRT